MLEQSLSQVNFRKVYEIEQKKGNTLEPIFFPEVFKLTRRIRKLKKIAKTIHKNKKKLNVVTYENRIKATNDEIRKSSEERNNCIWAEMEKLSQNVNRKSFSIKINRTTVGTTPIYTVEKNKENIFTLKVINNYLSKSFSVKQKNRDEIVPQISSLVNDKMAKYIIKGDIRSFFESINQEKLTSALYKDSRLNAITRKIIKSLLDGYNSASGGNKGIPRGVSISSYLAEIYLKEFDDQMRKIPNSVFYERYVDDFIIIITPTEKINEHQIISHIKSELNKIDLSLNEDKTEIHDLFLGNNNKNFDYLGYEFKVSGGKLEISISSKREQKYINRIKKSFFYYSNSKSKSKSTSDLLIKRIKFLTSNTRLKNNKSNAFIGVYYSNKFITDLNCFKKIQKTLETEINSIVNIRVKNSLSKIDIKSNFINKKYTKFSYLDLKKITAGWIND
jgi:hypothetical protein